LVARGNTSRVVGGHRDRERHLDDSTRARPRHREAGVREEAKHRPVLRDHLGDEARDALLRGTSRQLLEQTGADSATLGAVGHCEGDLGYFTLTEAHVAGQSDDALAVAGSDRAKQRPPLHPVGLESRRDEPSVDRRMPVEAQIQALLGELGEEAEESLRVASCRRTQPQRAAPTQDDIHGIVRIEVLSFHVRRILRPNRHRS